MKFYYTYILRSLRDNKLYIGYTEDLKKRMKHHQNGETTSLKSRLPFELIFYEAHRNKYDAMRRERYFKTSKGKKTLRAMLKEFLSKAITES